MYICVLGALVQRKAPGIYRVSYFRIQSPPNDDDADDDVDNDDDGERALTTMTMTIKKNPGRVLFLKTFVGESQ